MKGDHCEADTLPWVLPQAGLAVVASALVPSQLDYCTMVYVGLPLKTLCKRQLVQNH